MQQHLPHSSVHPLVFFLRNAAVSIITPTGVTLQVLRCAAHVAPSGAGSSSASENTQV